MEPTIVLEAKLDPANVNWAQALFHDLVVSKRLPYPWVFAMPYTGIIAVWDLASGADLAYSVEAYFNFKSNEINVKIYLDESTGSIIFENNLTLNNPETPIKLAELLVRFANVAF